MAPDEHDRHFDKALALHLRSAASSPAPSGLSSESASQSSSCPDPDTLAAYHERSLLPEELNSYKEHIVGCAQCQAILAQLEVTDSIPLAPVQHEKERVFADSAKKSPSPIPIRGTRSRWLVPAGALAAGLLVLIGFHENQRQRLLSHENESKMAKLQEPPQPMPLATPQAHTSTSADQFDALSKSSGAIGGVAGGERSREIESLKRAQPLSPAAKGALAKSSLDKEKQSNLRKDAASDSVAQLLTDNKADLEAKNVPVPKSSEQVQVQAQGANIQAQNQMIAPKVPVPEPLGQAEQSKKSKSESLAFARRAAAPPPPAPSAPVANFSSSMAMEVVAVSNPHLISALGTSLLWRAGRAGLIEFSSDNGTSWSRQTSGVLTDLTTGSAPSVKICWIVGRVGTILLTTDGGAHWSVIHSPLDEDLGGVRAVDALHATIWNLRNTRTFETADGGAIWKPVTFP